jgi:histidinol-phosphatase
VRQELAELLDFALMLARAAEEHVLAHYRRAESFTKPDGTEVTIADRMVERVLRNLISSRFPKHGILGEEFGESPTNGERFTWVLDPIDGTSWFTMGAPLFGTLIGLLEHGNPVLGVVHLPALQETLYAVQGMGCWFKTPHTPATRVHVAAGVPLARATILASGIHGSNMGSTTDAHTFDLLQVATQAGKLKFYGDCVQHVLVSRGHAHAAIDTVMKPWDIAALVPCIEEAGGVITSLKGKRTDITNQQNILTSCSAELPWELIEALKPHEQMLSLVV